MIRTKIKNENIAVFFTGCLLGILCFVAIYGVKILDFTYDAWLLNSDYDLRQHYVGWGHFRNSAWEFPFGLISTLSYPFSMSVIYTDSIPMVSVFFKLLSPILPQTFQFFGLYGLISFMLMGGLSILLVHRFVESRALSVLSSVFFILSFPMLQRMYYHTSLASQWIIILALVIWVYQDINSPSYKKCIIWGLMGFLCVGIHSYFLPMIGAIMLFGIIDECITSFKGNGSFRKKVYEGIAEVASFCAMAIINLWLLGAFYGGASAIGGGIGTFESNLNTFINPLGYGITGISLPLYYDFQYEGFGYLGLGMIMLLLTLLVGFAGMVIIEKPNLKPVSYFKIHHRQFLFAVLFVLFFVLASGPIFTINNVRILAIPLPGFLGKIADIFRSNGRFIWVSFYVLMLAIITYINRIMRKSMKIVVLCLALIIQIADLSPQIIKKQEYFSTPKEYTSKYEDPDIEQFIDNKTQFIIIDADMITMMDSAYYAFKHNMSISRFYYARDIDDKLDKQRDEYKKELYDGKPRENAVYIFDVKDSPDKKYTGLTYYVTKKFIIGVKE